MSVRSSLNSTSSTGTSFELAKFLAALKDRAWIFLAVFICGAAGTYFLLMQAQPGYKAVATMQILRHEESRAGFDKVGEEDVRSEEDINTLVHILQGTQILQSVSARVEAEMKEAFLAPYIQRAKDEATLSIPGLLEENRAVWPTRSSLIIAIEYAHPDPEVAAQVANLFSEEISHYFARVRREAVTRAVEDLNEQAEIQRKKVESIELQLARFKEEQQSISFDQRLDIDQQEMLTLKNFATQKAEALDRIETQINLVEDAQAKGQPVHTLSFIASQARIGNLLSALASSRIEIAHLGERYRAKHPKMIQAQETLVAIERELGEAANEATRVLASQRKLEEETWKKALQNVEAKRQSLLALDRQKNLYDSKSRELEVNQNLYQYLYNRIQETEPQSRDNVEKLRLVNLAERPLAPYMPQPMLSGAVGVFVGGVLGLFLVSGLALFDDRIKSHEEVEKELGLEIIGVLGHIRSKSKNIGELVRSTAESPQNAEALNSIVACLRLDPESRNAKTILVTSTVSNEGKSYVSASIASTFQRYGEKTLLINCDLRAREDRLLMMSGEGYVPYLEDDNKTLDKAIYHSQELACDVLPAGGLSRQPYQLFTGAKFKQMLNDLKGRYDRIIIDTPPTHLFGDPLSLLPYCDGQIFVVGFGKARLNPARNAIKRLRKTNRPMFGAVINGVKTAQTKTYYPSHYKKPKAYKGYGRKTALTAR